MVIEPESLIFFSVPSCASSGVATLSAAAASRANAVFIVFLPRAIEKFYLVQRSRGIAQPLGHGREQGDAEGGLRLHQAQEHVAVDREERELGLLLQRRGEALVVERDHAARGRRHRGGAPRRIADRRHLAEDLARLERADRLALGGERDLAFEEEVHLVALEE